MREAPEGEAKAGLGHEDDVAAEGRVTTEVNGDGMDVDSAHLGHDSDGRERHALFAQVVRNVK